VTSYAKTLYAGGIFLKRFPGVGSEPGASQFHLFSHFHHFTTEPQRLTTLAGFEPGSPIPEANTMSTAQRCHPGKFNKRLYVSRKKRYNVEE
jgi:hypothetical protein